MSEQHQRQRVVRALRPLDAISVENPVYPGTPDVNYIGGWLELKWLRDWPKRATSPVAIPHFTPQQRAWLKRRWLRGGDAFLLLQVGKGWYLLDGNIAAEYVGKVTRFVLERLARRSWPDGLRDEELREVLSSMPKRKSTY